MFWGGFGEPLGCFGWFWGALFSLLCVEWGSRVLQEAPGVILGGFGGRSGVNFRGFGEDFGCIFRGGSKSISTNKSCLM